VVVELAEVVVEVISVAVELKLVANVLGTVVLASLSVAVDWSCLTCWIEADAVGVAIASGTVTNWVTVAMF